MDFYPEDNNSIQISCPGLWSGGGLCLKLRALRMTLSKWPLGLRYFICEVG